MTYAEILAAHQAGKTLYAACRDTVAEPLCAYRDQQAAEVHLTAFYASSGWRIAGYDWKDIEVPDPAGQYTGSGRRYSLVPVAFAITEEEGA